MMSQVAYAVFVQGERVPFEKLVATLNHLWVNALGLKTETVGARRASPSSA